MFLFWNSMKKLDKDKDGQITQPDFNGACYDDPLLVQCIGPCLPPSSSLAAFLATFTENYRKHISEYGNKIVLYLFQQKNNINKSWTFSYRWMEGGSWPENAQTECPGFAQKKSKIETQQTALKIHHFSLCFLLYLKLSCFCPLWK